MSFKKMLSLGLAALLTLSCAATAFAAQDANQDPANTEVTDETLVIGLSSEPSALWGGGSGKVENEMQIIGNALMDTLVVVDRNTYEVKPNVATAWEWVDGTHCKFTLRDDVKMNDGNMLTADDVVYDVNTWIEYCANSDTGRFLVGAEANDEPERRSRMKRLDSSSGAKSSSGGRSRSERRPKCSRKSWVVP